MKRFILLALILLSAFYVGWPAYSGYQIKTALDAKDPAALASKIDFASVKESLRPAATAEAERALNETLQKAGGGAGALGADIAKKVLPKLVETSLNTIVTPQNIIRIFSEGGAVRDTVSRIVKDELGKSGGIAGLGALIGRPDAGGPGTGGGRAITGALDALGKIGGVDLGKVVQNRAPVRTVTDPAATPDGATKEKAGYGIGNVKRLGLSGPLSVEIGVAKDAAASEPDVTAEMSFTGTDWMLTALRPKI